MTLRTQGGLLTAAALALLLGASAATAQEVGISGGIERAADVPPEEKIAYAESANTEIDAAVRVVDKLLEGARRAADAEQISCLTTKATSVRALRQVSESATSLMVQRIEAGDIERADHEYRKIAVALLKARQLVAEAERCGDTSNLRDGQTTVTVRGGDVGSEADTEPPDYPAEFDVDFDPPDQSPFF